MAHSILIMDSGSYKTFGGSVRDAYNIYRYLSSFKGYKVTMLGDFSKLDKKLRSLKASDVFSENYAASATSSLTDYYLVFERLFSMPPKFLSEKFLSTKYDVILSGSRKDILLIDAYLSRHPNTKVLYTDRANILINYKNAGVNKASPSLLGTRAIMRIMRSWLNVYVSMTVEQMLEAKRFFSKRTKVVYIKTAPHSQYQKLNIKKIFHGALSVSRLDERQKRMKFMIKGIAEVIRKHPELKAKELLRIMGEGPHEQLYTDMVKQLGLSRNISFLGTKFGHDLVKAYNNCGFFVSTSVWESPGRTFLEAMACGAPIMINERVNKLMSTNPDTRMVKDGYNGMVYQYGNQEDFADRFYRLYSNAKQTKRMSENAYRFVRAEFDVERTVKHFKKEIDALLRESA